MNKPSGLLGDTLGQLGSLGKGLGQSIAQTPKDLAKTAASQVGIGAMEEQEKVGLGEQLSGSGKQQAAKKQENGFASDDERKQFLKDLYGIGSSKQNEQQPDQAAQKKAAPETPKSPQEQAQMTQAQQKLEALKQSQHKSEYYDPTFNRPEPEEERQAEKVEREKEEDERMKLKKEEKKKEKPMAVQMGAERAEKYRGAAG